MNVHKNDLCPATRTTISGYNLRKFRCFGHGPTGTAWTATIYRDGRRAVVVTDAANGEGPEFIALGDDMSACAQEMAAYRFHAADALGAPGSDSDAAVRFALVLKSAADIDQDAEEYHIPWTEALRDYDYSGDVTAQHADMRILGRLR
ncbi:hypothetical protein E3T54_11885 [Cryobacterium sp. Sr8]|uniref:hypothetical protein n=1 Tax=Cryobacterium sp. Sr8 TaxID=1259203 RepID=UPI00106D02CD|nr:hypothetical protein [Cryobacterium sp. Sr8]TFD75426.1 hypothetical protein E3T54_11885 [Cryobacterium sp. Sr8]